MKLNKEKIYDLSELTSDELKSIWNYLRQNDEEWEDCPFEEMNKYQKTDRLSFNNYHWEWDNTINSNHNAKELFYTLVNVAVLVNDLTKEQKKNLENAFVNYTYFRKPYTENKELISYNGNYKHTITYEKFMELFTDTKNTQPHYDNTNGSIYKFCNDQKLNSWEFDIIKRVVRCRKKGLFKEDLQKTKDLIDLYLKEWK